MSQMKTLSITLDSAPGALQRIVTVCARRRLEVVSMSFDRADARVNLCLKSDARQLAGARAWLSALIDVLAVREIGPGREGTWEIEQRSSPEAAAVSARRWHAP